MDYLRLFPFPNGHFVYVNDVHRLIVPMLITPALVSAFITNVYQKVYEFVRNYFEEIMFAVSIVSMVAMFVMFRAFDKLIDKIIKKYKDRIEELENKVQPRRFSQRLKQKTDQL